MAIRTVSLHVAATSKRANLFNISFNYRAKDSKLTFSPFDLCKLEYFKSLKGSLMIKLRVTYIER